MMNKKIIFTVIICILCALLVFSACGQNGENKNLSSLSESSISDEINDIKYEEGFESEEKNAKNKYAAFVTMAELVAFPEKYDGKLVRVVGVADIGYSYNKYLFENKDNYEYRGTMNLELEFGERCCDDLEVLELDGKYVSVEGIFRITKTRVSIGKLTNVSSFLPQNKIN